MYTKDKHNLSFFLLLSTLFLQSCSLKTSYITDTRRVLDPQPILVTEKTPIPLAVRKYYDDTGNMKCDTIPDVFFSKASAYFNPGFYKGVLWLDVFFADTTKNLGYEYMLDFGSEPLDFAEVYTFTDGKWSIYGRTGRMLTRKQMSSPTWRLCVPINEAAMDKNTVHHIRIKMMSHISSPVNIKLVPRRSYDFQTSWFSIICYLSGGLFIISILFVFFYGLLFKDIVYRLLSGSALFLFLLEVELKGTGPVYLWNFLVTIPHSPRLMYLFADCTIMYLIATFLFITTENNKKVVGIPLVVAEDALLAISFISTFTISSPVVVYFIIIGSVVAISVLFITLLHLNKISKRKDLHLLFVYWELMFGLISIRQLLHILRVFFPLKLFQLLDNEYYISFYIFFLLSIMPAIFITGRRLHRRFSLVNARFNMTAKKIVQLHNDEKLFFHIVKELLNEQNVLQNTAQLPFKGDSTDEKETRSLLLRTSTRSLDLLNAVCIFGKGYPADESPILLLDFFNSCIRAVQPHATTRGNTISVTAALSNDCIVSANPKILELLFADALSITVSRAERDTKIFTTISNKDGLITYTLQSEMTENSEANARHSHEEDDEDSYGIGFALTEKLAQIYNGTFTQETKQGTTTTSIEFHLSQTMEESQNTTAILKCSREMFVPDFENVDKKQLTISDKLFSVNGKTPVIVLVENSKENTEMITNALEKHCTVVKAINGLEAWNMLLSYASRNMSPDLIISEYYLPALNGSELFRKCKQEQILQDIPFIFLASVTEYAKKSELINKGAVDCLLKPFTITELLNRIYSVFTIQSMAHHSVVSKITTIVQESHTDTAIPEEKPQRRTRQTQTQQLQQPQPTELERTATVTLTATQQALFTAAGLSSREQQIALLISEGKSDKQIADELFISAATVATHNKKLFRKLGVHSRVELMNKVR